MSFPPASPRLHLSRIHHLHMWALLLARFKRMQQCCLAFGHRIPSRLPTVCFRFACKCYNFLHVSTNFVSLAYSTQVYQPPHLLVPPCTSDLRQKELVGGQHNQATIASNICTSGHKPPKNRSVFPNQASAHYCGVPKA